MSEAACPRTTDEWAWCTVPVTHLIVSLELRVTCWAVASPGLGSRTDGCVPFGVKVPASLSSRSTEGGEEVTKTLATSSLNPPAPILILSTERERWRKHLRPLHSSHQHRYWFDLVGRETGQNTAGLVAHLVEEAKESLGFTDNDDHQFCKIDAISLTSF